jgi:hypothetical protein
MRYLLFCCSAEKGWEEMPQSTRDEVMREYGEWTQSIVQSGHFRGSARLRPVASATSLRRQDGRLLTTDGPFAETREQIGGYHVIECENLDEAIAIAGRIPTLKHGGVVEVRPLEGFFEA